MKQILALGWLLLLTISVSAKVDWPLTQYGDFGENVYSLQQLLFYHGYQTTREGRFDYDTEDEVLSFQSANGLSTDGIVGENTWSRLCPTVSPGASGSQVRGVEHQLRKSGYSVTIDGVYDTIEVGYVKQFQTQYGLTSDGIVGQNTWRELLGNNNILPQPEYEFRGAWVATVSNIDWPSTSSLSVSAQKNEMTLIFDLLVELNMNAIIFQVRPEGDALYKSSIGEPWSRFLTGQQGSEPSPYYDPLTFAIEEAHKRGIELHAWFNPYRAAVNANVPVVDSHMCKLYSQYCYKYGSNMWMDPGSSEVQNRTYDAIIDVVKNYDVDGIHFDDYFYPYPVDGVDFPDSATYQRYTNSGGTLSLGDWRRDNVNQLVSRLYSGIHQIKPYVKFGISPFGIYKNGVPSGIIGFDQYEQLYADPKLWLQKGWVDYLAPQLYWRIDPPNQSYPVLLDWWVSINTLNRHVYVGNYLSQLDGTNWPLSEFQRQVEISRSFSSEGSLGNIMFSMVVYIDDRLGVNNYFIKNIYTKKAKIPIMNWLPQNSNSTAVFLSGMNNK